MSLLRRRGRRKARRAAGDLLPLLPGFVRLLGRLFLDRRVSWLDKGLVVAVVAYVAMPLDLMPDFLGVLGLADDLFLLGLAVRRMLTRAGEDVVAEHWPGSATSLRTLTGGLEDLGSLLPGPVRRLLGAMTRPRPDS